MSYLALARKWRPRTFADVAGQDHVVRALRNALDRDQVHHAYLFAGTRGVGKTTIARILAKALNCDDLQGSEPCGTCSACVSIDEGRFVDLLEVDAASRTKVDQTRELLENVQYTPTAGRCKVYLIDEVHMLSASSFNALLKTLEEPPPHVKFLLATTDPQKLPVTVLSRCLQFNLKYLPTGLIAERMGSICKAEKIEADAAALLRIARAAAGSMRDGLSLLDQALAFGNGALIDTEVAEMLGGLDQHQTGELLQDIARGDATALIARVRTLQALVPNYEGILADLAALLQQIAVAQLAGPDSLDEDADRDLVESLAGAADAEQVQLWYQIAVTGRRDLDLAPDPRVGFEMTLLRMLAFQPALAAAGSIVGGGGAAGAAQGGGAVPGSTRTSGGGAAAAAVPRDWSTIVGALPLRGAALQLARSCVMAEGSSDILLRIGRHNEYLLNDEQQGQLTGALQAHFGRSVAVRFEIVDAEIQSPVNQDQQHGRRRLEAAREAIERDPVVRQLVDIFGARIDPASIRAVDGGRKH